MSNRVELNEDVLEVISGGSINFLPANAKAMNGVVGINGHYTHSYEDEAACKAKYAEVFYSRQWTSIAERDNTIFQALIDAKLIKPIQ